ncbi:Glycosyltransferase involved in cell wall bisynthesis [Tranquillimonas alkanivorans]|uniref:Glycosyltransferase involved in cell wall bisynthesis n=2 Tax=Tranquillimonas alkanivorans TaxID=441119 RepID=A0A1I5VQP1_9RHOB|nr:Glycosyltransferase involved in cell wall bisynthesis [Tranquillimonas alkanivorans]
MMDGLHPFQTEDTRARIPRAAFEAPTPKALLLVSELEDYTIAFANGLAQHVPVVLAVPRRQYAELAEWFDPAVDLRLLDWPRHRSPSNLAFLAQLVDLVRRERPDIIHALSNNTLWLNLVVPLWRGTPVITTVHDVNVHPGDTETSTLPGWATSLMARQSRNLIVHGEALRQRAAERFKKPLQRVHTLPHPTIIRYADLARRHGLRRQSEEAFTVLFFGRIYAYKGIDLLMRAEALVQNIPNLRIVIAGRGDDPWALRSNMGDPARYDVRHRFIPDRDVTQLFLDADLVALPYSEASQSGVLHIAAAFGKPVVATDVGELGTTIRKFRIGAVVPPNDAGAFAAALEALAADIDLRNRLGARSLAWAEGENAPAKVGAKAERLYRRIRAEHQHREAEA